MGYFDAGVRVMQAMVMWAALAGAAGAQGADAEAGKPQFEVASVRPSKPGASQSSNVPLDAGYVYGSISADDARTAAGGHLIATHQALWRYIVFAYQLSATQEMALRFSFYSGVPKSGAPFWVTGSFDSSPEFFDIAARAPEDTSIDQMRLMMQALLSERFHLVLHSVTADAPVFALVRSKVGVTGPNLQEHPAADVCPMPAAAGQGGPAQSEAGTRAAAAVSVVGDLPPLCGVIARVPSSAPGLHFGGRAVAMPLLATTLPTMTGLAAIPRPVVDETGLEGLYDFTLTWVHDMSGDGAVSDNIANFRASLKTELGLELKASHAPMSFFVVDHVERPTEN